MDRQDLTLEQLDLGSSRARAINQTTGFQRRVYHRLAKQLTSFTRQTKPESSWIIMPGLRGVGKTTLLAQLYCHPDLDQETNKFYLSLDQPDSRGVNYNSLAGAIERRLGRRLHEVDGKLFVFLDEVHFWSGDWAADLKFFYDGCRHLFLVCTGSSALRLNMTPDSARRADLIQVLPLDLTESIRLSLERRQQSDDSSNQPAKIRSAITYLNSQSTAKLGDDLRQGLFESKKAEEVYNHLEKLQKRVDQHWANLSDEPDQVAVIIESYINNYLTLPRAVVSQANCYPPPISQSGPDIDPDQAVLVHDQIRRTMGTVLEKDLEIIRDFDAKTRDSILDFLRLLAHSDTISLSKISRHLSTGLESGPAINTIRAALRALTQAEILTEIPAWGSAFGRATKPAKYLFATPALRLAMSPFRGRVESQPDERGDRLSGRLLEDAVGMYIKRLFIAQSLPSLVAYDARSGGADFLISKTTDRRRTVVIEAGWSKASHQQINRTFSRLKSPGYGLVVSAHLNRPRLSPDDNVVHLPLSTFLLL